MLQYQEAIRLQPDYTMAHYNLGLCLAKTGLRADAIKHFDRSLQLAEARGQKHAAQLAMAEMRRLREAKP
jgi:tetratricopeptide (TPR) repeat protein